MKRYRRLLVQYLKPSWPWVVLLAVLLLGNMGLQLAHPQIMRRFIDIALAGGALETLVQAGLSFIGVALALFVYYLASIRGFTGMIGTVWALYKQCEVSLVRLAELLQGDPPQSLVEHAPVYLCGDLPPTAHTPKTDAHRLRTLRVSGLSYRHPDSGRGIEDVHLCLERGSFTVVTGRIGSGKTTLLRALLGLLPADAGEVSWNGEPVADAASFFVPPPCAAPTRSSCSWMGA